MLPFGRGCRRGPGGPEWPRQQHWRPRTVWNDVTKNRMDNLFGEINHLKRRLAAKESEIENHRRFGQLKQTQADFLKAENDKMRAKMTSMAKQLHATKTKAQGQKKLVKRTHQLQLRQIRKKEEALRKENADLRQELTSSLEENKKLVQEHKQFVDEQEQKSKNIQKAHLQYVSQLKDQVHNSNKDLKAAKSKEVELRSQVAKVTVNRDNLIELEQCRERRIVLERTVEKLKTENLKKIEKITQLNKECATLKKAEKMCESLTEELSSWQEKLADAQKKNKTLAAEKLALARARKECDTLREELSELQAEHFKLTEEAKGQKKLEKEASNSMIATRSRMSQLVKQKLQSEVDELKKTVEQLSADNAALVDKNVSLESELNTALETKLSNREEVSKLYDRNRRLLMELELAKKGNNNWIKCIKESKSKAFKNLEAEVEAAKQSEVAMRKALEDATMEIKELTSKLEAESGEELLRLLC